MTHCECNKTIRNTCIKAHVFQNVKKATTGKSLNFVIFDKLTHKFRKHPKIPSFFDKFDA
jgi:hypothetical protein